MSDAETWVKTVTTASVEANEGVLGARAGRCNLAVYAVDGQFYATDDICTHGYASLADGYLEGHLIECPLHQGMFDVRTGAAAAAPCSIAVRSFPARVEDGFVFVALQAKDL